ncbi:EAL domain-containing protein [Azoarcus sp. L1K30]|uniref:EAL domain-containing protein n=1 Tax=Azoarcus sp. L1K30 TaxID=2820277 RepID=UPI001B8295DC|nr:EAL domain-containing protein [Azoarcus sp. L1K30]MBR0565424.1 EAL domain-containing protein [Azoarcus sp. L1K30]
MRKTFLSYVVRLLLLTVLLSAGPVVADDIDFQTAFAPSPEEAAWLAAHPVVRLGIDPNYGPYSFLDEKGRVRGVVPDFLEHIEKTLGIRFSLTTELDWPALMSALKQGRIDAIATMVKLPEREADFAFSRIYLPTPLVIMTRNDVPQLKSVKALEDLRVALVREYSSAKQTLRLAPGLDPHFVASPEEGLDAVATGSADAYVGALGVNSFLAIRRGITNLKVNAGFDMSGNGQRFAIRKDWPELASLIDRALLVIPEDEKAAIFVRWLPLRSEQVFRLEPHSLASRLLPWLLLLTAVVGLAYLSAVIWNRQLRRELARRKSELERALSIARIGDWSVDVKSGRIHWADEIYRIAGHAPTALDWATVRDWIHPDSQATHDALRTQMESVSPGETIPDTFIQLLRPDGGTRWLEITVATDFDSGGKPFRHYGTARDISERKHAEEQIRNLAYFDGLTGLPNRRQLLDRLQQAVSVSARNVEVGALLMLDLDRFKDLNDTQGHDAGDELLIEVANRIGTHVRREDIVARLGGDEYVIIAENLGSDLSAAALQAGAIAEQCRNALSQPFFIANGGQQYDCTTSIGVTLFQGADTGVDSLLKQAEVALYQAKRAGKNAVRFFSADMQAAIDARMQMETALRQALKAGELQLHYQPQVDSTGTRIGAEALLRWYPCNAAPVPPATFIPVAEESGLILPIGDWVLKTACAQLKQWEADAGTRDLSIAVNVSARQFLQPDFVDQVIAMLDATGARPERLKLELTESVVLESIETVIDRMRRLKKVGITFSLDDFGTGYSSLSYLKRLPLDQVKIDQAFVRDITIDQNDAAIVRATLAMGQSLGLNVIAEGVETEAQHALLVEYGCPQFQGYLFSRPIPIEDW